MDRAGAYHFAASIGVWQGAFLQEGVGRIEVKLGERIRGVGLRQIGSSQASSGEMEMRGLL